MRTLHLKPINSHIGAEVFGIDLARPMDADLWAEIRDAFLRHKVLVFRNQTDLSAEQHKAFGARFGRFASHPFRPAMDGHPEMLRIAKEPDETHNVGGGWHTDMTFTTEPPLGTLLYAIELPPEGKGDTLFSDGVAAFAALSAKMQSVLRSLRALHSAERVHGPDAVQGQGEFRRQAAKQASAKELVSHPVVRTHPESGNLCLFVNPSFTQCFQGMTHEESQPLLQFLFEYMVRPEFVARVRWQPGTLTLWDNRCTQHYALNDYHGYRREMRRLMIMGDRPF